MIFKLYQHDIAKYNRDLTSFYVFYELFQVWRSMNSMNSYYFILLNRPGCFGLETILLQNFEA